MRPWPVVDGDCPLDIGRSGFRARQDLVRLVHARLRPRLRVLPSLLPSEVDELAAREWYIAALEAWADHRAGCVICRTACCANERDPCDVGGSFYTDQIRAQRDWYRAVDRALRADGADWHGDVA